MRRTLSIIFFIVSMLYFFRWLIPFKIPVQERYVDIAYLVILIPYVIYECSNLIKDDKVNRTHRFRNRILMTLGVAVIMFVSVVVLNKVYHP
jgi:uncharacterized membrane protein